MYFPVLATEDRTVVIDISLAGLLVNDKSNFPFFSNAMYCYVCLLEARATSVFMDHHLTNLDPCPAPNIASNSVR